MDVRSGLKTSPTKSPTGYLLRKNSYMNKLTSISVISYLSTGWVTDGQRQDSFHAPWDQSSKFIHDVRLLKSTIKDDKSCIPMRQYF